MAKYEVDRFESPPDPDLVCCICQCVLDKPLQSPCQHVFCKVCIETWLTNRKNCPNCRKSLRISKLKPVIPIVRNMINRLIIRCDNYSHGCIEGVKLEYYDVHEKQCDYLPLKCMNTGCEVTVLRKDMLAHEKECHFRLVVCRKGCGFPVAADQEQNHSCVAVLKSNMEGMEAMFNKKYKSLSESFSKLQQKVESLQTKLHLHQSSAASRDSANDDRSSYSTGAATPVPDSYGEDEHNSQRTPDSFESPLRENDREDRWGDTASDDSFITGRGTPVNREDQHSNWSWLNTEEDDQTDMADLEDSAVDALLASDADNSPNSPRDGNGSDRGHRRSSSVEESYGDSREDHRSSESAERDGRQSRRRASSQGEQTRYSLRSSNLNNADSTSNNLDGDISSGRDEEGDNDVTPVGSPTSPYSPTNTDDNSFEPTGSDGSPVSSVRESLRTSDTSPPSSPVPFSHLLNTVAQMNSSSDSTWSPSADSVETPRRNSASSDHRDHGRHSAHTSNNVSSQRSSHQRERDDTHHTHSRRRRSSVYYSSDEDWGHRRSDHSRKRSRRR
ncbi:uncharacterized protein [Apostichopus japonicus]|uniref:uncharacterized protein isoform X2 n=1 Tax=Stichopus japonicus TaxID=307972 RepID=UPI003AB22371